MWRQIIDGSVKLCKPRGISLFMGKEDGSIIGKMTIPNVYRMDEALNNEFDHM